MDKNVQDAKEIGGLIDTWGKVVVFIGTAIVSCAFAYYMLLTHEHKINDLQIQHQKDFEDLRTDYKRQYGIMEEKSQKQFEQGMKVAVELKIMVEKQADILREHEKNIQYQIGWREAEKFYKGK